MGDTYASTGEEIFAGRVVILSSSSVFFELLG